jgi:hypothetical protein
LLIYLDIYLHFTPFARQKDPNFPARSLFAGNISRGSCSASGGISLSQEKS